MTEIILSLIIIAATVLTVINIVEILFLVKAKVWQMEGSNGLE